MTKVVRDSQPTDSYFVVVGTAIHRPTVHSMPHEDRALLRTLHQHIDCRAFDVVRLTVDGTEITAWVDDEGMLKSRPVANPQAMRLAAHSGRPGLVLFGPAVITGGSGPEGETLGLRRSMADRVSTLASHTSRSIDRRIISALVEQDLPRTAVEQIAAVLFWSRTLTHHSVYSPTSSRREAPRMGSIHAPSGSSNGSGRRPDDGPSRL